MKLLYWNIGKIIDTHRWIVINDIVTQQNANIVCIAEGTSSKDNCTKLTDFFEQLGYTSFFNQ